MHVAKRPHACQVETEAEVPRLYLIRLGAVQNRSSQVACEPSALSEHVCAESIGQVCKVALLYHCSWRVLALD